MNETKEFTVETIVTLKGGDQGTVKAQLFQTEGKSWQGNIDALPGSPLYSGITKAASASTDGNIKARFKINMPEGNRYATASLHHFSIQSGHCIFDIVGDLLTSEDLLRPW